MRTNLRFSWPPGRIWERELGEGIGRVVGRYGWGKIELLDEDGDIVLARAEKERLINCEKRQHGNRNDEAWKKNMEESIKPVENCHFW